MSSFVRGSLKHISQIASDHIFLLHRLKMCINNTTIPFMYIKANSSSLPQQGEHDHAYGSNSSASIDRIARALGMQGQLKGALDIFHVLNQQDDLPDSCAYASLLQACLNVKSLPDGKLVHAHIILTGTEPDIYLGTKLVLMYAKCGSLVDARRVLDEMPNRNTVPWSAMIAAYVRHGHGEEALKILYQMQRKGFQPDEFTFASVIPACANLAALGQGKEIHGSIIRSGFESDIFVANGLVDMYAKCRRLEEAQKVFDTMPTRDVVSWSAMIAGCAQNGYVNEALKLFLDMPERNVISWNAMIAGYAQNGHFAETLKLFRQMQQTGMKPNPVTYASVLPACASIAALEQGKEVHEDIIRNGFQYDIFARNALVDMYAKCGSIENAEQVFYKMPERNVVSWTAMIAGYAQTGHSDEAVKLFQQMKLTSVKPNSVTFASVLSACANLATLHQGKEIHEEIIRSGFQFHVFVGGSLVDMYAKCGCVEDARSVFHKLPKQDVVSWTAMIVGYAMHGRGKEALLLFEQMQKSGTMPNHVTFVGVLSACCHAGLIDDGWLYFNRMSRDYHISPAMEHYCCMVDLLGRAGRLDEAQNFINKMPIKPNAVVWGSLLAACRIHTNIELGERVAELLFNLDPKNSAHYVLLSNIYAAAGRWDDKEKVRKMMKDRRVERMPGQSWVEINNKVYTFHIGDRSHPQTQ
eukprot:Gb_15507 [translate_table: standard]